ncbi:hypothetical protein GCM10022222_57640 [Amycolatopsis ultiminotia]|uniref:GNAT family N-acetyltransferase n=1 Tax=Amycolatopsis ultiminotia TaxID=543629 RepID=A0ABP6XF48_9PSEU
MTSPCTVSIRRADEHDVTGLPTLRRAWSEEQAGHPLEDDVFEEQFAQWYAMEAPRRATFVAEVDGKAVGTLR